MARYAIAFHSLYSLLKPPGYNPPWCFGTLVCQWLHQGFLWGWYSYNTYSKLQARVKVIPNKGE